MGNVAAKGHKKTVEGIERIRQANHCRVGPKANHWKGGVTPISRKGRTLKDYHVWRQLVLKRDGYRCSCGATTRLTVHHIKSYRSFPELRYEVNNGQTLCPPCHGKVDKFYRSTQ